MFEKGWSIIPNAVLFDERLKDKEKLLFTYILSLCSENGYCFASNQHIADKLNSRRSGGDIREGSTTKETISRLISKLSELRYIGTELTYKEGTKEVESRKIFILDTYGLINQYPIDKLVIDNNTITNNNIYNNHIIEELPVSKKKKEKEQNIFLRPCREEVYLNMGKKKGVEKFCDILEDCTISQDLSIDDVKSIYGWMIGFFKEKYAGKFYEDKDGNFHGGEIVLNELDKFYCYYSENKENEIKNLRSRLRKWITNSTSFNSK